MNINKKFELEDRLYLLGFSHGMLETARKKQITVFIEKYENDLERLEKWIEYLENNKEVKNKGGYLREVMRQDYEPNN